MTRLNVPRRVYPGHVPIRLGKWQERLVYILGLGLLLSGAGWLLLEHGVRVEGEFGPTHHWAQAWLLKAHGVLAMFAVWGFGVLWSFHIRPAWRLRRHRNSGGLLFASVSLLSISGLLLYYAGNETLRGLSSLVHWIIGFAGSIALIVHGLLIARRGRSRHDSDDHASGGSQSPASSSSKAERGSPPASLSTARTVSAEKPRLAR
ncbi:hypothetical protein SAMN04488120_103167 [Fontimonas thermophila]|uniref:Cytochrome b561 n=1 Tax=Fontimonas thermophila TaxID=1076937 RepID=A0A1I2ICF2_9GAMM|nr:hypothetical protein SAMN04488120_103167 [Fontimonas thermophila]